MVNAEQGLTWRENITCCRKSSAVHKPLHMKNDIWTTINIKICLWWVATLKKKKKKYSSGSKRRCLLDQCKVLLPKLFTIKIKVQKRFSCYYFIQILQAPSACLLSIFGSQSNKSCQWKFYFWWRENRVLGAMENQPIGSIALPVQRTPPVFSRP